MSLFTSTASFLAIKPRVWVEDHRLMARSAWLWQILTFFSYAQTVTVDRQRREVMIETRILWLMVLVKKIPLSRVAGVGYKPITFATEWSIFEGALDRYEIINVSLELVEPRESQLLFRFMGEGAIETGVGGVLYGGDSMIDFQGDQTESAQDYMTLLEQFTGRKTVAL